MYDSETLTALQSGALVLRDFLTIDGQTLGESPARFAYWTGEGNVTLNVVPAGEETPESRSFIGDGALAEVPQIIDAVGFEARSVSFGLDHIVETEDWPLDMVFGNNIRVARVELHRGVFDPETWHLVSEPHLLLHGRVDGAELTDAEIGGTGSLSLDVANSVIDLTRINPAFESDEQQRLRGDRFRRYGDAGGQIETWWGQAQGNQ